MKRISINKNYIKILSKYFLLGHLKSRGFYWVLSMSIFFALLSINYLLKIVNESSVSVISSPFEWATIGFTFIMLVFVSISVGGTIIRQRELGILELMFGTPISFADYLLSASMGGYLLLFFLEIVFIVFLLFISIVTGLKISIFVVYILLFSLIAALPFIGMSVFLATVSKNTKGYSFFIIMVLGFSILLSLGNLILVSIVTSKNYLTLIVIRDVLTQVSTIVYWISPVEIYFKGIELIGSASVLNMLGVLCYSVIFCILLIFISILNFYRRGILP